MRIHLVEVDNLKLAEFAHNYQIVVAETEVVERIEVEEVREVIKVTKHTQLWELRDIDGMLIRELWIEITQWMKITFKYWRTIQV